MRPLVVHTLFVQLCVPLQVPHAALREVPQLSAAVTVPQFLPRRVQNAVLLSGVHAQTLFAPHVCVPLQVPHVTVRVRAARVGGGDGAAVLAQRRAQRRGRRRHALAQPRRVARRARAAPSARAAAAVRAARAAHALRHAPALAAGVAREAGRAAAAARAGAAIGAALPALRTTARSW